MANSLIVFSDGTGNRGGVSEDTNIWRLYKMIDRSDGNQHVFYEDGVGTQDATPYRLLSSAFGLGLTNKVLRAYKFIASNYKKSSPSGPSKIYLFGFSRGAYTVRLLLGLIQLCGLIDKSRMNEKEFEDALKEVKKAFRSSNNQLAENLLNTNLRVDVEFIGAWDTVDAVGVPIDELKPLIMKLPKLWRRRQFSFKDRVVDGARIARHALAIDDERRTFHPNYWSKAGTCSDGTTRVDLNQVWFTGMHSNVGGGYPKDGLAYVTLEWMIAELKANTPIKLLCGEIEQVSNQANECDKLYDSRKGAAVFYRYSPRRLSRIPSGLNDFYRRRLNRGWESDQPITVHISVWMRIRKNAQQYAPLFVNPTDTTDPGNKITNSKIKVAYTNLDSSLFRPEKAEKNIVGDKGFPQLPSSVTMELRKLVRSRQWIYAAFLLLVLTALILGFITRVPVVDYPASPDWPLRLWLWIGDMVKIFVPRLLEKVIDNGIANPPIGLGFIVVIGANYMASRFFSKKIQHVSRHGWNQVVENYYPEQQETNE